MKKLIAIAAFATVAAASLTTADAASRGTFRSALCHDARLPI